MNSSIRIIRATALKIEPAFRPVEFHISPLSTRFLYSRYSSSSSSSSSNASSFLSSTATQINQNIAFSQRFFINLHNRAFSGVSSEDSDQDFVAQSKPVPGVSDEDITKRIQNDLKENLVVLYMKGLPSAPQCGFSYRAVQVLNAVGVEYRAFNVLANPALREGIKKYSSWPTIPQLFVKGDFIGGCDIIENMYQSGELQKLLKEE